MTNWKDKYNELTDGELNKIAVLRVMECTNGVIQHAFRDNTSDALPVEDTRATMKFSMSCMKNMAIPLKEETLTFASETQELLREARDYYTKGMKRNDDDAYAEFMKISKESARACGMERIVKAQKLIEEQVDDIPTQTIVWGVEYLMQFF